MSITFTGKLCGTYFDKIRIIVDNPKQITNCINDVRNPYQIVDDILECYVMPIKYKDYYLFAADAYKFRKVTVTATIKRYSFDGKKGTTLLLKQLDINDI